MWGFGKPYKHFALILHDPMGFFSQKKWIRLFLFFKLIIEPDAGAQKKIMVGIYFIIFHFIKLIILSPADRQKK